MRKSTEELINEITSVDDIVEYLAENEENIDNMSLSDYLNQIVNERGLDKSIVFRRAKMNETNYGYELFRDDKKKPSRDKLIQLCFGLQLTIEEATKLLRLGKVRPLYPRDQRDAFIIYALKNKYPINKLNDLLFENGEELLG
ncbi:MAG: XRE family transcriptional regulator [Lachnospiraceae bacterium]|nr:XRE family transcriptional regulator [Lachnospiraceae bacterium]